MTDTVEVTRPVPRLVTARGLPAYDGEELRAYREAMGVTPDELAVRLKTHRPYVVRVESARYTPLEARIGDRLLGGVEAIVKRRAEMREAGLARLAEMRKTKAAK